MKIRKYTAHDYPRVIEFLGDLYQLNKNQPYWLPGHWEYAEYLVHPLHISRGYPDWKNYIGILEENNKIIGVVNSECPDENIFLHTHPNHKNIEEAMISWAEKNLNIKEKMIVWTLNDDVQRKNILQKNGYQEQKVNEYLNWRNLNHYEPKVLLAEDFEVHSFADAPELLDSKMECTAKAFGSEKLTDEMYRTMQSAPTYNPSLDLYITYKKDTVVSACTVWKDDRNDLGYFEPMATHPNFQRKGLGKAILNEGMRRLKKMKIRMAYVGSSGDERMAFYNASGFTERVLLKPWEKKL